MMMFDLQSHGKQLTRKKKWIDIKCEKLLFGPDEKFMEQLKMYIKNLYTTDTGK